MAQLFITFLMYFSGVIFYFLTLAFFELPISRIIKIAVFILACVPVIGPAFMFLGFAACLYGYKKNDFYFTLKQDEIIVRNTKLNRFLFNDVNWNDYDEYYIKLKETDNKK